MKISLKYVYFVVFVVLSVYTFLWYQESVTNPNNEYFLRGEHTGFWRSRDVPCVDLVLRGELYHGQLSCAQGPVGYLVGDLLKLLFGNHVFDVGILITLSLIAFVIFALMFSVCNYSLLVLPAFLLLVLPMVYSDFSASLSCLFVLLGLYLIYNDKNNKSFVFAGLFCVLSLFTKTTNLLLVLALIPVFVVKYFQSSNKVLLRKKAICFVVSFAFFSGLLLFLFPNTIIYTFLAHVSENSASVSQIIFDTFGNLFIGGEALHLVFIVLIILLFVNNKKMLPFLMVMCVIIFAQLSFGSASNAGVGVDFKIFNYHLIAYLLVFVGGCIFAFKENGCKTNLVIALLVIFWSGFFALESADSYYSWETSPKITRTIFDDFLNSLDYSEAFVDTGIAERIDKPVYKINYHTTIKPPELWGFGDSNYGPGIKRYSYDEAKNKVFYDFDEKVNGEIVQNVSFELLDPKINLVVVGFWKNPPYRYMPSDKLVSKKFLNRCIFYAPVLIDADAGLVAFTSLKKHYCENAIQKLADFYVPKLQQICSEYGQTKTEKVVEAMNKSGIKYSFNCVVADKKLRVSKTKDLFVFLFLFSALFVLSFRGLKNLSDKKYLKYLLSFVCFVSAIVSILLCYRLFD